MISSRAEEEALLANTSLGAQAEEGEEEEEVVAAVAFKSERQGGETIAEEAKERLEEDAMS